MAEDDLYASESDSTRGHSSSSGTGRYHSLISSPSVSSSGSRAQLRPPTLISSYHSRAVDDTVIDDDEYVYPGDSCAIPSQQQSSSLNDKSDDQFFIADISSSAPRNSVYSSAESYSSKSGTGTRTRTFIGLTSSGIIGTGTTDTYTRTGRWSARDSGTDSETKVAESTRYTGYTDYESRTGYGSRSYSGSPYTGTASTYSPYTETTGPPYAITGSLHTGTCLPYTSTATYSSPYTRSSTSSSYPPTSPSRSTLNRTAAMRRRTGTTTSYSSSGGSGSGSNSGYQPSEESSDSQTPNGPLSGTKSSGTGYDVCPSELSSDGENLVTASQRSSDYLTTRTPSSEASFKSLPSIPSEYITASEGSIAYKTISEPITEPTTAYSTAEMCPSKLETIPSEEETLKAYSEHLPELEELPSVLLSAHLSALPSFAPPSIPSFAPPSIPPPAPPCISSPAPPSTPIYTSICSPICTSVCFPRV
ncbi:hypothetical protein F5879DRAFT_1027980 [Lentinula edodes]|nr:hypothetical protein F5879DRAFT_1027980 [Lentinula edodes]